MMFYQYFYITAVYLCGFFSSILSLSFLQTPSWFPTDNQSKLNGLFFIKNISTTKAPNVTKTNLNIQPQVIFPYLLKQINLKKSTFTQQFKILKYKCVYVPTDFFLLKFVSADVVLTFILHNFQGFSEINITVIECPTWREGKETADKRVLLDVIKAVKTEKSEQEGRIIVLSR